MGMAMTNQPTVGSVWVDKDCGGGYLHKYKGISTEEPFKGRLHFVRFDYKTGEEFEGGLWIGSERFKTDMISAENLAKHPCCGQPTLYPIVWCDDCGYETWAAARDAKEKAA